MDNDDNILIRYLDGVLTMAEKEAFEKELEGNESLKAELESLRAAKESIRLFGLNSQVERIHSEVIKEMNISRKAASAPRRILRYGMAIAASLLLIIGAYVIYNFITLSSDKVFASRYQSYTVPNLRDGQSTESAMEKAFKEKNFRQVLNLHARNKNGTAAENFLCGMAAMELKDNTKAIDCFKKVLLVNSKSGKPAFQDETEYYLALTYIRNKDYDFALDLLKSIKSDPGHPYNEKVTKKLLRQVKMLKWR